MTSWIDVRINDTQILKWTSLIQAVYPHFQGACKKLDHYPESVEEFVEHLSFLGKMSQEMPALEKEYNIVTKLYTIARDFEVSIEPEELALYQTLSPSFQHLKVSIVQSQGKR